jgi:hypothetical protein
LEQKDKNLEEKFQKLTAEMSEFGLRKKEQEEKEAALPERWREIEEKIKNFEVREAEMKKTFDAKQVCEIG